jgi:hypothetical protein
MSFLMERKSFEWCAYRSQNQFLTTYTQLVTLSVLPAMPWVTGSPDQIPDLPLDAVGILEDSDHLRERAALVRAVLEHSQSHGGDPVVPRHMIRPELIAYWNRVGKPAQTRCRNTWQVFVSKTLSGQRRRGSSSAMFRCSCSTLTSQDGRS